MNNNSGTSALTPDLTAVLRRAEVQQANLSLELQFQKNMAFFQQKHPDLFERYINYTPTELKLLFTDEGYVNLVNSNLNDKPVYPKSPEAYSQEYVDQYTKEPIFYKISAQQQEVLGGEKDAHITHMAPLIRLINDREQVVVGGKMRDRTNLMVMLGIGLGYQINQLLEYTHIHHLMILEPHEDIFYASLHTLDWPALYQHFEQLNHSVRFFVGLKPLECYDQMRMHLSRIGLHNAIKPFVFEHLSSAEIKETAKVFFERIPSIVTSMGYFDDEQTSIAHTVNNYRKKVPLLREHALTNNVYRDLPAFVIGNGPSLDKAKDFLLEHHQRAVIFSCGSATGSLRKLGIKPDFHVELERTWTVVEWIQACTDPDYRKDIILLGINTVPPDAYDLFDRCGMAMKSNDLGTHYISQFIAKGNFLISLSHCNPTVVNTGMTYAEGLGFRNIYLFGVDLGFPNGDQHHSSLSVHYDVKDDYVEKLNLITPSNRGTGEVAANFGGKVQSTAVYNNSRQSLEAILNNNPNLNCYNTSDGALIKGTQPLRYGEIHLSDPAEDKQATVTDIYNQYFHNRHLFSIGTNEEVAKSFAYAANLCDEFNRLFNDTPATITEAFALLNKHHNIAIQTGLNKTTQYAYTLLKGSINSFNLALAKCLMTRTKEEEAVAVFNEGKQHYQNFLCQAKHRIENELFKNDDRRRDLGDKFKTAD